jgi:hypothetical protein
VDPIAETILEILGAEISRRLLGPEVKTVPQPANEPLRQGTAWGATDITVHLDQMQGPPCDLVEELYEDRLFDRLMEDDDCGCNQRRYTDRCKRGRD